MHFGRLIYEMCRIARLVIDTYIHSQRWTRQQTPDFLADNTLANGSPPLSMLEVQMDRTIARTKES